MSDLNSVNLTGRLTWAPEVRYVSAANGSGEQVAVVEVNLANGRHVGRDEQEVSFIGLKLWGKSAETLAKHAVKGSPLWVTGRIKQERWLDRETQKERSRTIVEVGQWGFNGPAPGGGES